ncbi:N-acetylmuramoyl-L-alanine amidase CwlD [Bacillus solimangrovi]|uniref:N-acetylmuramoyl-L-alanine amidase CwlD n=1 Tax=Bacillus solimangrovi TaxID=1305675 RepID=A0A1E5LGM3_9BACI|nr:N-acetylmuramoyl-L-alanine amidase CwlD [Bacillus solimangrovi]OEH93225.1 N-acetylmuramoyl-L-alanine amidase CwlD [Bacillus solimangrovi]
MKRKWIITFTGIGLCGLIVLVLSLWSTENVWNTWNLPLSGKVIVLDAGHGGADSGAIGDEDLLEKDIALNVTLYLRDYLQEAGALVYLTREKDIDLAQKGTKGYSNRKREDLKKRVEIVNDKGNDLFLSIHLNAIPSPQWHGAQTFYYPHLEESERLSKFIQYEIRRNLENTNRYAKAIQHVYLMKHAKIPGALVEIGFLSNPHERELLRQDAYQEKMAAAIYQGVLRYYTGEKEPEQPPID